MLWALVIIMGALILIGMAVVIVTIAKRLGDVAGGGAAATSGAFVSADLPVPPGCEVVETVPVGERLLLRLGTGERCRQLLIVDMATGRLLGRLNLVAAGE